MIQSELLYIYVDLDALLDTRLTTILQHWPEAAARLVADDAYYLREMDEWLEHGISKEDFRRAYDRRDINVLRGAIVTPNAMRLNEIISHLEVQNSTTPGAGKPVVELNIWPYKLDDAQRTAYINAVMNFTGVETLVTIINRPPQLVTMSDARHKYAGLFMYDFAYWARLHTKAMSTVIAPSTTFYAPTIFLDKPMSPDDLKAHGLRGDVNPVVLVEMGFAEKLALDMLPTFFFCPVRPERAEEWMKMFYEKRRPDGGHPASQEEDARRAELAKQAEEKK